MLHNGPQYKIVAEAKTMLNRFIASKMESILEKLWGIVESDETPQKVKADLLIYLVERFVGKIPATVEIKDENVEIAKKTPESLREEIQTLEARNEAIKSAIIRGSVVQLSTGVGINCVTKNKTLKATKESKQNILEVERRIKEREAQAKGQSKA